MNKVITTAAVILCLAGAANAGDARTSHNRSTAMASSAHQILVGVDADFALPLSTYGDINGPGAGALLTIEYPVIEQVSLTARAGFQYHLDKSPVAGVDTHVHSIPVLLGAKYYVMQSDRQGLFAAAELGMFDLMTSATIGGDGRHRLPVRRVLSRASQFAGRGARPGGVPLFLWQQDARAVL